MAPGMMDFYSALLIRCNLRLTKHKRLLHKIPVITEVLMPISFSHWQTWWGECWQTTFMISMNWQTTLVSNVTQGPPEHGIWPTANKQNHRVKIKILFWSLLLTQEKEPEWRVKLSLLWLCLIFDALLPSIGLANTVLLLATHMWDGWPMLPCQQFCGQRTWLSVLMQHTALFGDHTYHFALQKLSANIAKWISQSHSVQHEEILDDHQQGCWIWPCIYTTPENGLHIRKWHSWDSSVFLWF